VFLGLPLVTKNEPLIGGWKLYDRSLFPQSQTVLGRPIAWRLAAPIRPSEGGALGSDYRHERRDAPLVDVTVERARVEQVATDIVEPEALARSSTFWVGFTLDGKCMRVPASPSAKIVPKFYHQKGWFFPLRLDES
jgi:hypothetical protein